MRARAALQDGLNMMRSSVFVVVVVKFLLFVNLYHAFYLPGLAPVNYCRTKTTDCTSEVKIYLKKLDNRESVFPFEYHEFDFCGVNENNSSSASKAVFIGERVRPLPYKISFGVDEECVTLCTRQYSGDSKESAAKLSVLKKGIIMNYYHHWIIDNTPVMWCYEAEGDNPYCATGFPMGCYVNKAGKQKHACLLTKVYNSPDTYYIFNHVDIMITYHPASDEDKNSRFMGGLIISAKVIWKSIKHPARGPRSCVDNAQPMAIKGEALKSGESLNITYTYSVIFKPSKWSSRWDFTPEPRMNG